MKSIYELHATLGIHRVMTVRREEYLDYMTFRANERPLFTEFLGPLVGLKDEWRAQGASDAELDFSAFTFRAPMHGSVPVNCGFHGGVPEEILEETAEYVIARDALGRRLKLFKQYASIPLPLDYPVRTMDDWLRFKPHFLFTEERFEAGWEDVARRHRADGHVVSVHIPGGFDLPRQLMGDEAVCIAFYEQPELIHDILQTAAETAMRVLDRVSVTVPVDELSVHEDFAGKSGPLLGPAQLRDFVKPYFRRVWDMLRDRGARLFSMDTDGNINGIVPSLLDCGLNVIGPMEPAAHMDIVQLRAEFGTQLAFTGGIDKHVLRRSRDEIVAELEYKIPPMVRTGGCLLSLDHRIPNGTPLEHYRFYLRKAWEILDREAARR